MSVKGMGAALVSAVVGTAVVAASGPFVYPQRGQGQQQQDQDRAACDRWARSQTGIDPNAPPPSEAGRHAGGTVGGAARGAAVGAAVGAIAGNAGKGAGAGAVVGGVAGRRGSRRTEQAAVAETQNTFMRAFAACMEGRGYTVR